MTIGRHLPLTREAVIAQYTGEYLTDVPSGR